MYIYNETGKPGCTLSGHPGLQVSLSMYTTWKSWSTNLILNVHYPEILIYKFHYKGTLSGYSGLQVSL
jgi:hypothetical protein